MGFENALGIAVKIMKDQIQCRSQSLLNFCRADYFLYILLSKIFKSHGQKVKSLVLEDLKHQQSVRRKTQSLFVLRQKPL